MKRVAHERTPLVFRHFTQAGTVIGMRFRGALAVACILAVELLLLADASRFGDFLIPGNASRFVPLALVAGVCYLLAVARFERASAAARPALLWGGAVLLRLAVLGMPVADDLWWRFVTHREVSDAIFSPGSQWVFTELARMDSSPLFFKGVFALADLGTIWLLLRVNTGSGRYRATAWYAWNPLVICAFAGAGHDDSLLLFPLMASALALHRADLQAVCAIYGPGGENAGPSASPRPLESKPAWHWAFFSAVLLGFAISIQPIALVFVPLWVLELRSRAPVLIASFAIPLAWALPYGGFAAVARSWGQLTGVGRFNDFVGCPLDGLVWSALPGHENGRYAILLALVVVALSWVFRRDWRRGALWVAGTAFILTPVLHPWYVTWVLPFACWRKAREWFVFSLTLMLLLLASDNTIFGPPGGPPSVWLKLLIVAPPLVSIAVRFASNSRRSG